MLRLLPLLLVACKVADSDSDPDTDPDPATAPSRCDAPICISTDPDAFVEGRVIAANAVPGCFYATGLESFPPARILIDGVEVLDSGGVTSCIRGPPPANPRQHARYDKTPASVADEGLVKRKAQAD